MMVVFSHDANSPARAQGVEQETSGTQIVNPTYLAYIRTGNPEIDRMNETGLYGLGSVLYDRTNIENIYITRGEGGVESNQIATGQVLPRGLDLAKDDLSTYSFIYWAIDPEQPQLSKEAVEKLNAYMREGKGLLFIDTRDRSTNNRGKAWLQRAVESGLDIPALAKVEGCDDVETECHVVGKSFYLLEHFPGRYAGGYIWAENTDLYRENGVATVLIGGNEWAAAWAMDQDERHLYPVIGDDPEQREMAYRVGVNLVMYAFTGNYKADQIHIPDILRRMKDDAPQPSSP